ncbi:MAG: family phosphatase [Sphingomonas bacterium]|uniref:HAD family hydrolase n=1 Tax=Sphingomonas bacterium TaxID=1895847 RepID=UPI00260835EE|nr:HAD family phosphatase [Sphingomonas bacterium]MDB5697067.1 family phosphatase [Sphingomonas bacterium]
MTPPTAIIFDIGRVLYRWDPRFLYERHLSGEALDSFLRDVVTPEWHFQHDAGRDFADTSAELMALHPQHAELIAAWAPSFLDTIPGPVDGMPALVDELHARDVPLYALTNFSHEFWPPFRARETTMFDRFRDILVSGEEKLVKPDPAIYARALDRFGLVAAETVFIDDNEANVVAAAGVGLIALHFADEPTLRCELAALGLLG